MGVTATFDGRESNGEFNADKTKITWRDGDIWRLVAGDENKLRRGDGVRIHFRLNVHDDGLWWAGAPRITTIEKSKSTAEGTVARVHKYKMACNQCGYKPKTSKKNGNQNMILGSCKKCDGSGQVPGMLMGTNDCPECD